MIISENIRLRLKTILTYTGIESSLYQIALFIHQYMLYKQIGPQLYGYFGTIFSLIYLATMYLNLGLDLTIAPLFNRKSNCSAFIKSILLQALLNGLFGLTALCATIIFLKHYINFTAIQLLICGLIAITEMSKKTLKSILHLLFFHRLIAITELICLGSYLCIIWTFLFSGYSVSIFLIFAPLLLTSLAGLTVYLLALSTWPSNTIIIKSGGHEINRTISLRAQNYLYQITHSLYSPNFLIPMIAMQHSMELASLLKIISMGLYAINSIIQHVFSIFSTILFSHIRHYEYKDKQLVLQTLQKYMIKIVASAGIYSILHYYFACSPHHGEYLYIACLFFSIICSEHLILAYEHFFIIEERATFLSLCNLSLWIPIIITKNVAPVSIATLLVLFIASRTIHFFILYIYGYYWQLPIAGSRKPFYTKPVS